MAGVQAKGTGGTGTGTATVVKTKTKKAPAKQAQSQSQDLLLTTANQIENLSKVEALDLVTKLLEEEGLNDFRLGGVLAVIQTNSWFDPYTSFRELIESKFGIQYRKGMYLIGIYNDLVSKQIPWEKVAGLGWTKLKELSKILTPKNVDAWVKKAEGMTVLQLQEAIKSQEGGQKGEDAKVKEPGTVTTMTFKLHSDQKEMIRTALDKAKGQAQTEFDTVALEAICVGYLSGTVPTTATAAPKSLKQLMQECEGGFEEVLQIFEQVFPDITLTVEA